MAVKNKKEKVTIDNLAQEMRNGFAETKNAIEGLAIMTKHGFDGVSEQFNKMDEKLDDLEKTNNQAHENTSLRLNEVAYSFELVELKKRVEIF